jgi:hypothetical protein
LRKYSPEYYAAKREKFREYFQKYYRLHRSRILVRTAAYRTANREKVLEGQRQHNYRKINAPVPTRPRPETCEICGRVPKLALGLDHCHTTNIFRGWLCDRCNRGLGFFDDTLAGLMRAVKYLERAAN